MSDTTAKEFSDFVAAGRELIQKRDDNAWELGDLAVEFEVTVGRPSDPDAPKLGDLAHAWNVDTPRVSEWRNVARFYPENVRTFEDLSWGHYNTARRASDNSLKKALELLGEARRQSLGIRAFQRFINGTYYEGEWKGPLPEWLQGLVPRGMRLWVTVKRMTEDN